MTIAVTSDTINLLYNRSSVRAFRGDEVPDETVDAVCAAALRAPTSFNFQAYALVVLRDRDRRAQLAAITGQKHVSTAPVVVVICADVARLWKLGEVHRELSGPRNQDFVVSAIIDASLAGMCLAMSAQSLGLGTVMVGAVRNRPDEVADLLALPAGLTALFAVCLGWPAVVPPARPRLRADLFIHQEYYHPDRGEAALTGDRTTLEKPLGEMTETDVMEWQKQVVRGLRCARRRESERAELSILTSRPATVLL